MDTIDRKNDVLNFFKETPVMSIAVSMGNKPISSVVMFTFDNDLCLYFLTKRDTYKDKALKENPQISCSVWKQNDKLVQVQGDVIEISEGKEFDLYFRKISALSDSFGNSYWPLSAVSGHEYVVYKILSKWIRVMDLSLRLKDAPYYELEL